MHRLVWTAAAFVALAACMVPGPKPDYSPHLAAADFGSVIDNPFLPMPKGAHWTFESKAEHIEVRVLDEPRTIQGV